MFRFFSKAVRHICLKIGLVAMMDDRRFVLFFVAGEFREPSLFARFENSVVHYYCERKIHVLMDGSTSVWATHISLHRVGIVCTLVC